MTAIGAMGDDNKLRCIRKILHSFLVFFVDFNRQEFFFADLEWSCTTAQETSSMVFMRFDFIYANRHLHCGDYGDRLTMH